MRTHLSFLLTALTLLCCSACRSPQQPPPVEQAKAPEFRATATVQDLMDAMVSPSADFLWSAVSTSVGEKGAVDKAPHSDAEWNDVRRRAITLIEASDLLTVPGRRVAAPGAKAEDPTQLSPEQIQALMDKNMDDWVKLAHGLHDAVVPALKAVEAKNTEALSEAGGNIDQACESCHLKYWYPNQPASTAPAADPPKK